MTTLALPRLYDAVKARFASEAGAVSMLATALFAGTASLVLAGSSQLGAEVVVRFPVGGTVGVSGITYQISLDAGTTWGDVQALGVETAIPVHGSVLTLGAGTVVANDQVSWTQNSPVSPDHVFGWNTAKRSGALRIMWVPGDDLALGELVAPREPGRNPRPIFDLEEYFTVLLEAYDPAARTDNRAQYIAARLLFDAWLRAAYLAAPGSFRVLEVAWVPVGGDAGPLGIVSQLGATIRATCVIRGVVPDAPLSATPTNTSAVVASIEGTQTDTDTITPT